MPKENHDTYEWLYDGKDLPPDKKESAVNAALSRIKSEVGKVIGKPAIGLDERMPGFVVCIGLAETGPFRFNIPLDSI